MFLHWHIVGTQTYNLYTSLYCAVSDILLLDLHGQINITSTPAPGLASCVSLPPSSALVKAQSVGLVLVSTSPTTQ